MWFYNVHAMISIAYSAALACFWRSSIIVVFSEILALLLLVLLVLVNCNNFPVSALIRNNVEVLWESTAWREKDQEAKTAIKPGPRGVRRGNDRAGQGSNPSSSSPICSCDWRSCIDWEAVSQDINHHRSGLLCLCWGPLWPVCHV